MSTTYSPRADSIAGMVIGFFRNNPNEELDLDAITQKFDATRGNIHTLLGGAVDSKMLVRERNVDGDYIYKAGPALQSGVDIDRAHGKPPAPEAKPTTKRASPSGYTAPRKDIDLSALTVDEDVPYEGSCLKGQDKWQPLFDKLTRPGQSIALPLDLRGAVGAATQKINKLKTNGSFRVAKVNADTCRVWRVA